jgi:hypothetical protein
MVKDAIKTGFEPAYVLADSWFICDTFVSEIQKIKIRYTKKLHLIGLMKTNRRFIINDKKKWQFWCQAISKKTSDIDKNTNVIILL